MVPHVDICALLEKDNEELGEYFAPPTRSLACPVCGDVYQHTEPPYTMDSKDRAGTVWEGRGDLIVIPVWGECGVRWQLCLGFHKGVTGIFARLLLSCTDAEYCGIAPGPWAGHGPTMEDFLRLTASVAAAPSLVPQSTR